MLKKPFPPDSCWPAIEIYFRQFNTLLLSTFYMNHLCWIGLLIVDILYRRKYLFRISWFYSSYHVIQDFDRLKYFMDCLLLSDEILQIILNRFQFVCYKGIPDYYVNNSFCTLSRANSAATFWPRETFAWICYSGHKAMVCQVGCYLDRNIPLMRNLWSQLY